MGTQNRVGLWFTLLGQTIILFSGLILAGGGSVSLAALVLGGLCFFVGLILLI